MGSTISQQKKAPHPQQSPSAKHMKGFSIKKSLMKQSSKQQTYACTLSNSAYGRRRPTNCHGMPEKLFLADENPKDKLVGVVVTIFQGESYDQMFRENKPTTVPGERVSTYAITCEDVKPLHDYLAGVVLVPPEQDMWKLIVEDIRQVPADSVVFNWECCSECGDHHFPSSSSPSSPERPSCCQHKRSFFGQGHGSSEHEGATATMEFMAFALQNGYTVMCSDFSLKSLIFEWSEEHLGPNPFIKIGSCDHQFQLEFIPADLTNENVPQQLQVVGQLCSEEGKAVVSAMGDTILYTINPDRKKTDVYDLKVLTVVTDYSGQSSSLEHMKCSIGEGPSLKEGAAGHVTLTYASGGQLVTSMGHWIELTRIDTSLESVLRVAAHEFGDDEVVDMQREYAMQSTDAERFACIQKRASTMVQKSAPTRMKARTKFSSAF